MGQTNMVIKIVVGCSEKLIKEGLMKLMPRRKAKSQRGRKITVHTKELGGPRRRKKKIVIGEVGEDQETGRDSQETLETRDEGRKMKELEAVLFIAATLGQS